MKYGRKQMKFRQLVLACLSFVLLALPVQAADIMHKIVFQVNDGDTAKMNLTLNNIENVKAYYEEKGEQAQIELVTYGPGLKMLMTDSPVKDRISVMALEGDNIQFSACANTHRKMSKKAGKEIELMSESTMVPSGVVRAVELQEQGYSYVKP
jgi:intracellular sulfur oxidation DsrE/DsrF family protein